MREIEVLKFITLIRKTFGRYEEYSGGCYKFYLILKQVFPEAIGYYNDAHVITRIGDKYYDIDGEVKPAFNYLMIGGDDYPEEWVEKQFEHYL